MATQSKEMQMTASKTLSDIFEAYAGKNLIFVESGGNWGDHLIYMGAQSLARTHNITFRTHTFKNLAKLDLNPADVVYIQGGGGYNSYSRKNAYKLLKHILSRHGGTVIQGPCTVAGDDEVASDFQDAFSCIRSRDFIFFARERTTYQRMKDLLPDNAALHLDHDTALHLTRSEFLATADISGTRYDLVGIREDTESAARQSHVSRPGLRLDPAFFAVSFRHWLRLHALARTIVTNRTHSAIAGAILGTPTTLFTGAYHKNRSIWEYSLKAKGVTWLDIDQIAPQPPHVAPWEKLYRRLPKVARRSWKVQRMTKWLQGAPLS